MLRSVLKPLFRVAFAVALLVCSLSSSAPSQDIATVDPPPPPAVSDLQAVSLLTAANVALKNSSGTPDLALVANATSFAGSDTQSGAAAFKTRGNANARLELPASGGRIVEVRADSDVPSGRASLAGQAAKNLPVHNCWPVSAWFAPVTALAALATPANAVKYVGPESRNGVPVEHIRAFRNFVRRTGKETLFYRHLTTVDVYLDSTTHLPLAMAFVTHPEDDASTDIPVEVRFSDYRSVTGIQVPFRIQKLIQGTLNLDLIIQTATINAGVSDSDFTL